MALVVGAVTLSNIKCIISSGVTSLVKRECHSTPRKLVSFVLKLISKPIMDFLLVPWLITRDTQWSHTRNSKTKKVRIASKDHNLEDVALLFFGD